jgi:amino acid permease
MMGAAVLSGGYVFRSLGAIPACLLILLTVIIYVILNNFYIDAFYYTNSKTFRELAQKLFGVKLALTFDIVIIFLAFGTLTSYQVISSKAVLNLIYKFSSI